MLSTGNVQSLSSNDNRDKNENIYNKTDLNKKELEQPDNINNKPKPEQINQFIDNKVYHNRHINIIKKVENNKDGIMVTHDKINGKFTFYDYKNSQLGSFDIHQLIKYLGSQWQNTFMNNIDISLSIDIINALICNVEIDKDTNRIFIKLKSYIDTPFMGNIEMLMKLNGELRTFELNNLENELNMIENLKIRKYIRITIKQFIYQLLNHTLKVIANISEEIKHDNNIRKELKDSLLKNSVAIVYRISSFVNNQLEFNISQIEKLNENSIKLKNAKNILINKIDNITSIMEKQSSKIDSLFNKIEQRGGKCIEHEKPHKIKEKIINVSVSEDFSSFFSKSDSENEFKSDSESDYESESESVIDSDKSYSAIYNL
jgi:hypothetical protein